MSVTKSARSTPVTCPVTPTEKLAGSNVYVTSKLKLLVGCSYTKVSDAGAPPSRKDKPSSGSTLYGTPVRSIVSCPTTSL